MITDALLALGGGLAGWLAHSAVHRRRLSEGRRDPVTGLPTRAAWTLQATRILRHGRHVVLLVDLDRFKQINDARGHAAGDHVLAAIAARIRAWTDSAGGGACGRLGGDEFVIVSSRAVTSGELDGLAAALAVPVTVPAAGAIAIGASIGAAVCTPPQGLSQALAEADAAMYAAKRAGGGCWQLAGEPPSAAVPARRGRRHGLVG